MIHGGNVIDIMQNTLDCVDPRLMNHGKRVAYLVFRVLKAQNKYTAQEMRDICMLAMLHDIGAYKTEEIEKMVIFETVYVWEHSIYGYLFLKYFSPLCELAPVVCFHHADCDELRHVQASHAELAQIISLCDRADVLSQTSNGDMSHFQGSIEKFRDTKFRSDIIDLFFSANINLSLLDEDLNNDKEFAQALYGIPLSDQEATDYIKMIILSIEFRSRQTALHTIAVTCIAKAIAALAGLNEADVAQIGVAAMLHDIGKTGVPLAILEKPDRLSESEMEIMKSHINISEQIIDGNVTEEIKRIAVRHHEKLTGNGYPRGLRAEDLSFKERLLAVADIFSALCGARSYKEAFSKEKVIDILESMSARGFIDAEITRLSVAHFDFIMEQLRQKSEPVIEIYDKINREYEQLLKSAKDGVATGNQNFGGIYGGSADLR